MQPLPESDLEDDAEWVALYPDDKPGCSLHRAPEQLQVATQVEDVSLPQWRQSLVFRKKVPRDEVLAFVGKSDRGAFERKKRLGKRKCTSFSEDASSNEMRKQEECRQRKKAFVGDVEERLGAMSSAFEELNGIFLSNGSEPVQPSRRYLYQAPASSMNCYGTTSSSGSKHVRTKRPKLGRRDRGGNARLLRRLKKFGAGIFVLLLCLVMLFFPIKVGMQGIKSFVLGTGSSIQRQQKQHHVSCGRSPDVYSRQLLEVPCAKGPRFGELEGSSHPGKGTGVTNYARGYPVPDGHKNGSTGNNTLSSNNTQPLEQWKNTGKFFTTGKCTEVFQYRSLEALGGKQLVRGNPALKRVDRTHSSMKVSILPRKSSDSGGTEEIFVVIVIDGVKYVTYSCTLPRQISP